MLWRNHSLHVSQILEGIHFGANTCRACIRIRTNTGKNLGDFFCFGFVPGPKGPKIEKFQDLEIFIFKRD